MKRATIRNHGSGENAAISDHAENHTRVNKKARLRPMTSARRLKKAAPTNMPRNAEASTSFSSLPPSANSVFNAVPMAPDKKIS
jgi:hypothetical protein